MRWTSVRVRIGIWYALFTFGCLTVFGVFIIFYLGRALEASRAPTMVHRAARLVMFANSEHQAVPDRPIGSILSNFLDASPESDEILVYSVSSGALLFSGGGQPFLRSIHSCSPPCFQEFRVAGHHYRRYSEQVTIAGTPVLLTLSGSVDEHYGILSNVRTSYLLFVPFLLLASLSGGYLLSGRALRPVGRITSIASRLSIDDLQGRVPVPATGDELQTLAEAWNSMLARLQLSVERNAQFTSDISHDLRTTLAVMLATTQLSLRRLRTPEQYREALLTLNAECDHTLRILEGLIAAARSGFEHHQLQPELLDFASLIRERCSLFAAEAEQKDQTLTVLLIDEAWMSGDKALLHRMIGVLVDNAIKYTPQGGTILVGLEATPAQLLLKVSDSGPGIAPVDLSRIFNRAFRVRNSVSTEAGSGLGLSIARWIAEAHNATLEVRSELGHGSTFEVLFPPLNKQPLC